LARQKQATKKTPPAEVTADQGGYDLLVSGIVGSGIELGRSDEARKHLDTAITWMERGTLPFRASSVGDLLSGVALPSLAAVALVPPDPRLNSLDPFTAVKLAPLRAKAERAMGSAGSEPPADVIFAASLHDIPVAFEAR